MYLYFVSQPPPPLCPRVSRTINNLPLIVLYTVQCVGKGVLPNQTGFYAVSPPSPTSQSTPAIEMYSYQVYCNWEYFLGSALSRLLYPPPQTRAFPNVHIEACCLLGRPHQSSWGRLRTYHHHHIPLSSTEVVTTPLSTPSTFFLVESFPRNCRHHSWRLADVLYGPYVK